jgi:hypothetical protein
MKKTILRILITAILLSMISGIVVMIIGLILKWNSSTQFSNGLFGAGAIEISIGLLFIVGAQNERTVSGLPIVQPGVYLKTSDRFKLWEADITHGYNILAFLGTSGLLLFGQSALALLVGTLF